ncbi:hypothetical protein [Rhodococcus sp. WS3]|uniref:hypothetical protein n=1 Tax=Rhodococcus sp. WS3 TaxID=2486271 RepID=UPI001142B2FA|nr:hypothetical protein [Rhodococcus sp. WS3]
MTFDPETGSAERKWNYLEPETVPCAVVALNPEDSLEQFGKEYTKKKFVKLENSAGQFELSQQAGNLRSKDGKLRSPDRQRVLPRSVQYRQHWHSYRLEWSD